MADFEVNVNGVMNCASSFEAYSKILSSIAEESGSLLSQLRGSLSTRVGGVAARVSICTNAKLCQADMKNLSKVARQAVQVYVRHENNAATKNFTTSPTKRGETGSDNTRLNSSLLELLNLISTTLGPLGIIGCGRSLLISDVLEWIEDNFDLSFKYTDDKLILEHKKNDKQANGEKFDKIQGKIGISASDKVKESIFDARANGNSKYADGSSSIGIGNVEGSVSGFAGSGYYRDKDGNLKWATGVDAGAGCSISLLEAEAEGRIGLGENHDLLGLNGSVDASVCKVGAEAKASVGLFDGEPQAYIGASAEATLAEVNGSAGVTVAGTDVKVTGGLNVGIGAHANVGYKDGKLNLDVGLSFGLGANVGLEIDVSGTVSYVKKGIKKLFS